MANGHKHKRMNGNLWKIVTVIISVASVAGVIIYGYGDLSHQVDDNANKAPEITLNTEHRITDEAETPHLKEAIKEIKNDLDDFTAEQRIVNDEILRRLPD